MEHPALLFILPILGLAMASQLTAPCDAAQVQAQAQPIYDTDGHEVTKENFYSILPADPSMSGLCIYSVRLTPEDCRLFANIERCRPPRGDPVKVTPAEASGGSVPRLSSDVLLSFNNDTWSLCMMSPQWHVVDYFSTRQTHVITGHTLGAPVPEKTERTESFRFRVERHGNGYKLTSCVRKLCRDLVLFDYNGYRLLTVEKDSRQPFVVVFKKCPWPCHTY
jgi:hypothetical protein